MGREFEPGRAIEVISPKYGSAYQIGGRLVLTAAHVLGEVGSACRVRAKERFEEVAATVVWKAKSADIALIELSESAPVIEPAVVGRLPEGSLGEKLNFQLYGYPLWGRTQRDGGKSAAGGRQIEGIIYLADRSPDGLLVLEAKRLPPEATSERSQWEGASGGAVVCGGVVVAVQSQHQNPKRPASLEAAPLWVVYEDERWCELLRQHGISPEPAIAAIAQERGEGDTFNFDYAGATIETQIGKVENHYHAPASPGEAVSVCGQAVGGSQVFPNALSRVQQIKRNNLQQRLDYLVSDYEALVKQRDYTTNLAERNALDRQLTKIAEDMNQVAAELDGLGK